ncbi:MAG: hypothetical protein FWG61_08085 [Firmicutes bacterium]|nr:hypothetical protein [Bacillota bacterium]
MKKVHVALILLFILLIAVMTIITSCNGHKKDALTQEIILEPGITEQDSHTPAVAETIDTEPSLEAEAEPKTQPEEDFIDQGRASTINDLMANKAKITSYYFEQTIYASYGEVFVQTWYANGWMKIVSSFTDGEENIEYFDCENLILVSHAPSAGNYGMMETFEEGNPDIPKNHLDNDYHNYKVVGTESIDGQICRILESRLGEKLWVSTKHGFPLQVEFNDPTNDEHFLIAYEGITFNQVRNEDVAMPQDLEIIMYQGGLRP